MHNNKEAIDNIIYLLTNMSKDYSETSVFDIHPAGSKYILGQTLRQLILPESNIFYTYKADAFWKRLRCETNDPMSDYVWQKRVVNEWDEEINISTYKGASKTPVLRQIKKGDWFPFRQVFHDEHIIPMKIIIEELCKLDVPTYDTVMEIISQITICRMLKTEDRRISERSRRPFSRKSVIEDIYLKYDIMLKDYEYPHLQHHKNYAFEDSIEVNIPRESIVKYHPHPESYGEFIAEFANGMVTDIYTADDGSIYSITNDNDLIRYIFVLQEAFLNIQ